MVRAKTYRNFVFTAYFEIFSPVFWESGIPIRKYFRHVAFSLETCESTGRLHVQGFCSAWHPITWEKAKNVLQEQWPNANVNDMKDQYVVSEEYCSKENRMHQYGVAPNHNGVKTSLLTFKRKLDDEEKVMDIASDDKFFPTYVQYRNGLKEYESHVSGKRLKGDREAPEVYIRYGAAGAGKTRFVYDNYDDVYSMPDLTAKWAGTYNGQPTVLFDDVESGNVPPLSLFKKITDRYPIQVQTKGGFVWWKPKRIFFTSNHDYTKWWPNMTAEDKAAVLRRVTSIKYLSGPGEEHEVHAQVHGQT